MRRRNKEKGYTLVIIAGVLVVFLGFTALSVDVGVLYSARASAQRAGVRCLLTEDLQDGFILQSVRFVNPFKRANDRLIDEVLPPAAART